MSNIVRIATFNIHKGLTHFNARLALHAQRDILERLHTDIVFLQEVHGAHEKHSARFEDWPSQGQLQFLATNLWPHHAYGKNAVYPAGHHGNAILSKFPIQKSHNLDISAHRVEQRGLLHCEMTLPHWNKPLHAICLHLGLFARWRRHQLGMVTEYIQTHIPSDAPLIVAGDFNDWSMRGGRAFAQHLHLHEVFEQHGGKSARSFPSWLPILKLDRIYVRGLHVQSVEVDSGARFFKVSDHAVLSAALTPSW